MKIWMIITFLKVPCTFRRLRVMIISHLLNQMLFVSLLIIRTPEQLVQKQVVFLLSVYQGLLLQKEMNVTSNNSVLMGNLLYINSYIICSNYISLLSSGSEDEFLHSPLSPDISICTPPKPTM